MRTKCLIVILFGFIFSLTEVNGKGHFTWTADLEKAYHLTTSLQFDKAKIKLEHIELTDPKNYLRLHVENYLDFFHVYINEDQKEFELLERNKDDRLKLIEEEGDPNSPYYLYLQADIRLQWALARLKFEEYATAFFETNKAFKLLTKNDDLYPDFLPNKKDLGILHAMVGTIPDNYKWAIDLFSSMEGTFEEGKKELELVLEKGKKQRNFIYLNEIYVYYAYLLLHLGNDSENAWKTIAGADLNPKNDPMACFILANVAMRSGRGDEAIDILLAKPASTAFHPFPYLDYMLGIAKLQKLDKDAGKHFEQFLSAYKGRNFIKDAYQKLAWHHLINANHFGYEANMAKCKTLGFTIVGSDQSALQEAKSGVKPNIILLKARILSDGGRNKEAINLLKHHDARDFQRKIDKTECYYRKGRVHHALKDFDDALVNYQSTIDLGKDEPWYFACRAALEKGHIYETLGKTKQARESFELCLDINPDNHKTGLHQQAKAGLQRLKN